MTFYVDGACSGNGTENATGAFGVIAINIETDANIFDYYEKSENTTNNKEELKAILYVMKHFGSPPQNEGHWPRLEPIVYSDSAYAVNTYNDWMFKWAKNDWKKTDDKTPENLDIIQEYYELYQQGYRIDLQKVKGHADNKWNNQVDKLARTGTYDYKNNIKERGLRAKAGIIDE